MWFCAYNVVVESFVNTAPLPLERIWCINCPLLDSKSGVRWSNNFDALQRFAFCFFFAHLNARSHLPNSIPFPVYIRMPLGLLRWFIYRLRLRWSSCRNGDRKKLSETKNTQFPFGLNDTNLRHNLPGASYVPKWLLSSLIVKWSIIVIAINHIKWLNCWNH